MVSERARTVSLVVDWLDYLSVSRALAPNTIALFRRLCFSFVDECVRDRMLEVVTTAEIEGWLQPSCGAGVWSSGEAGDAASRRVRDSQFLRLAPNDGRGRSEPVVSGVHAGGA
jgi:hypothetical protein